VLDGVSLEIGRGEFVALVGSNNAGKSTLVDALAGVLPLWSGRKTWDGKDITKLPPNKLASLGIVQVAEGHQLFPRMSVADNLLVGAITQKDAAGRRETMERVFDVLPRLKERVRQDAGTLSGGEQQMLAIGCGLMARPQLLLLDEPSLGLAPKLIESIFDTLAALNAGGLGILVIEQNLKVALSYVQRGYVLERGSVVLSGPASELAEDQRVTDAYFGAL
jgi:branched-chain amino acid transport system ATP-binding protein